MSEVTESDKRERIVGRKVEFRILDEEDNEVYSAKVEPRTKGVKMAGWIDRYKKSEGRVSLGSLSFQHLGRIELFYYLNEPETLYIGHDNKKGRTFSRFQHGDAKRLFGLSSKAMQHLGASGQYSKKVVDKRIKKYREQIKELEEKLAS